MAAGDIVIGAAAKLALLERLKASVMEGGTHQLPSEKSMELADILKDLITAVTPTG